jgi:hypothetical protein
MLPRIWLTENIIGLRIGDCQGRGRSRCASLLKVSKGWKDLSVVSRCARCIVRVLSAGAGERESGSGVCDAEWATIQFIGLMRIFALS